MIQFFMYELIPISFEKKILYLLMPRNWKRVSRVIEFILRYTNRLRCSCSVCDTCRTTSNSAYCMQTNHESSWI